MKETPVFLTVEQVLTIHRRMIDEFGGDRTVRDYGLLESAVMMPAAKFDGRFVHNGIAAMAAAHLFHFCKNHPFVDGNKRTALASAEVFLLLNDLLLPASNHDLEQLTLGVAAGQISKEEVLSSFGSMYQLKTR